MIRLLRAMTVALNLPPEFEHLTQKQLRRMRVAWFLYAMGTLFDPHPTVDIDWDYGDVEAMADAKALNEEWAE